MIWGTTILGTPTYSCLIYDLPLNIYFKWINKSLPPVNFEEIWGRGPFLELGCFAIKDADGWSWWEVMVHECGASLFNFTADYRSSIFWRWLGRSGVTLGTLSRTLDDRRCLWSWHRGCWGYCGEQAEREENWQKRVGYWFSKWVFW